MNEDGNIGYVADLLDGMVGTKIKPYLPIYKTPKKAIS